MRIPKNLILSLIVLGCGLANLYALVTPVNQHRAAILHTVLPLVFIHISRFFSVLIGFALVVLSINIHKRKRRALHIAILLSAFSAVFCLTHGLEYEQAALSLILIGMLWLNRKEFTVKSGIPRMDSAIIHLIVALGLALAYGVLGFWFLDTREFGVNFTIRDSIQQTLSFLYLSADTNIIPQTRHAHWFIDSLYLITTTSVAYALFSIFQPVVYRLRTLPHERKLAEDITKRHGRSSIDFFKYWPDKTFFFSDTHQSYIAFRVGTGYAVALGDPVGPKEETAAIIRQFADFCSANDWRVVFHQTLPDFLPLYKEAGFRKLKIGDDAIVDLRAFDLHGKEFKKLRHTVNQLDKQSFAFCHYEPPISPELMNQLKRVSDGWLRIPGRRERAFTLGRFDQEYIRTTPVYAVAAPNGQVLAFANGIPSFCKGEATIDLMRYEPHAPAGIMDYLFIKLFYLKREEGFDRFNLGMAPLAGFGEHEEISAEERAVHYFISQLGFLFSFQGLLSYKAKFATIWEPRYTIYPNILNLPGAARAISEVSESSCASESCRIAGAKVFE